MYTYDGFSAPTQQLESNYLHIMEHIHIPNSRHTTDIIFFLVWRFLNKAWSPNSSLALHVYLVAVLPLLLGSSCWVVSHPSAMRQLNDPALTTDFCVFEDFSYFCISAILMPNWHKITLQIYHGPTAIIGTAWTTIAKLHFKRLTLFPDSYCLLWKCHLQIVKFFYICIIHLQSINSNTANLYDLHRLRIIFYQKCQAKEVKKALNKHKEMLCQQLHIKIQLNLQFFSCISSTSYLFAHWGSFIFAEREIGASKQARANFMWESYLKKSFFCWMWWDQPCQTNLDVGKQYPWLISYSLLKSN